MRRMMILLAVLALAPAGVAIAQHQYMPPGPFADYVNIGDYLLADNVTVNPNSTEISHNLVGWGAIQNFWGGGGFGDFNITREHCRPMWHVFQKSDCTYTGIPYWAPPSTYPCPDPCFQETGTPDGFGCGQPWGSLTINFGPPGGTKKLYVRYLDGGGGATTDDFNLTIGGDGPIFVDTAGGPVENWMVLERDVSAHSGVEVVRFDCLGANSIYTPQYGQCCIDQVGVTIELTDPVITPVAADADPISCSGAKVVTFRYTPGVQTVRGYSVRVQCTGALSFHESDVTVNTVPVGAVYLSDIIENVAGSDYTIDYAVTGPAPITAAADLFSIAFHGNATGTGVVSITAAALGSWSGPPIAPVIHSGTASILVDCTAPDTPVMTAEPTYTRGAANTVAWSDVSGSGATAYYAECSADHGFSTIFANSGWITGREYEFTGLTDGQAYHYRVMARDGLLNASGWSNTVSSTQDATAPATSAGVLTPLPGGWVDSFFDVTYQIDLEVGSGVASVVLYYKRDGVPDYTAVPFTSNPMELHLTVDGTYYFYTIATDAVGNVESPPATYDVSIMVDGTPPATHVNALGPWIIVSFFDITYTLDLEGGSGFAGAALWYMKDGGTTYTSLGDFTPEGTLRFDTGIDGTNTGDGLYYFYSIGRDLVGNAESPPTVPQPYDASVNVDTANPTGSFVINNDATYTTSVNVTLNNNVTDANALQMHFSNDGTSWSEWEAYAETASWELGTPDGTKTVYGEFRDAAGRILDVSDDIVLDTAAPVLNSFTINSGAAQTSDATVTLNSDVTGADQMRFKNDGGAWSEWEPYAAVRSSWLLVGADGTKLVHAEYRDLADNACVASDTIVLDTSGPVISTFVINGDAVYTNTVDVTLEISVAGADEMRFSNDSSTWPSTWLPYDTTVNWVLDPIEGLRTVYAQFRDLAGNLAADSDDITLDTVAPAPVTNIVAVRGHNSVSLSWDNPNEGETTVEIWRAGWVRIWDSPPDTVPAYPEYDDWDDDLIPARRTNRDATALDPFWKRAGSLTPAVEVMVDNGGGTLARNVYWYEIFVQDPAGNWSAPAAAIDRATSYLLGDVVGDDGDVTLAGDITGGLALCYGTTDGAAGYNNVCDVGRTDDWSGAGIPLTDSKINFDDLMIFALNYDITVAKSLHLPGAPEARFAWVRADAQTWALHLQAPCSNLKGLRLHAELPEGAAVAVSAGALLTQQDEPWFLQNIPDLGLDVGFATLGNGVAVTGQGELMRVRLGDDFDPTRIVLEARGLDNRPCEFTFESGVIVPETPTVHALSANYPNPFNPMTRIDFALPTNERVRLSVYAMDGRLVATLVDASMAAGSHTVTWTGCDEQGRTVPSGTYFYRIQAGVFCSTHKMTLLK
ncbi:MAG: FlgD immunoglobulin-like domain containing protein [Candidatus Latescibacteria bacterium]|nr:FlgD immunoglobulin-like domain containing protein [Candidatus Latescibacterota bacterium]